LLNELPAITFVKTMPFGVNPRFQPEKAIPSCQQEFSVRNKFHTGMESFVQVLQ
jgi:hypothetical protein